MGLLFWLDVAPLIAALLICVLPRGGKSLYRTISFLGIIASLIMGLVVCARFATTVSDFQATSYLPWFTLPNVWLGSDLTVGLSFGIDGLSLPLLLLAALITLFAIASVKVPVDRSRQYFLFMSLAAAGIFGVFTSLDLFTFLFALEITLFAAFFLIYLFGREGLRKRAAFKFLIYRGVATIFMLIAFVGVAFGAAGALGPHASQLPPFYMASGNNPNAANYLAMLKSAHALPITFDLPQLIHTLNHMANGAFPAHWRMGLFIVLLLAVFIEEAFVPFHTWLPTTHEAADTGTNMVIGGILTKTGAYVLLRVGVALFPGEVRTAGLAIAVIGVINILYGAFAAWAQKDWRRLIAFSSISHMGLVLLGISALNSAGLQGAMFLLVSSGLLTALLFYITQALEERTATLDMRRLGGLSKSMPMLCGFLLVAALGSLGLPLTSGFVSEIQAFIGGFGTFPILSMIAALGVILSAVYMLYAMQKTTFGPQAQAHTGLADARPYEYVPIVILTLLVLFIGIYPDALQSLFGTSVHALLRIGG